MSKIQIPEFIEQQVVFRDFQIRLKRIKNLDALVDQVSDDLFNEDERLPYWAELWPSSLAMGNFLSRNQSLINGKEVLELGCGLGLNSLILGMLRPSRLIISDYEQDALDLARENFRMNQVPLPEFNILDWRNPLPLDPFDVIVASDVAYEKRFFKPLINTFVSLLKPGGKIVLAEPNRSIAKEFIKMFRLSGFDYNATDEFVNQDEQKIRVTIYLLRRSRHR